MSTVMFLENPAYRQFVHQLLELHSLMAQGQSETPQADALREEMLQPWRGLSPEVDSACPPLGPR